MQRRHVLCLSTWKVHSSACTRRQKHSGDHASVTIDGRTKITAVRVKGIAFSLMNLESGTGRDRYRSSAARKHVWSTDGTRSTQDMQDIRSGLQPSRASELPPSVQRTACCRCGARRTAYGSHVAGSRQATTFCSGRSCTILIAPCTVTITLFPPLSHSTSSPSSILPFSHKIAVVKRPRAEKTNVEENDRCSWPPAFQPGQLRTARTGHTGFVVGPCRTTHRALTVPRPPLSAPSASGIDADHAVVAS